MDKRQAKKIIYEFLIQKLNPVNLDEFLAVEAKWKRKDMRRLEIAAEDVQQELLKRARGQE